MGARRTNKRDISPINVYSSPKTKARNACVALDFENNLTVDALVDSGAFVSEITQDDLETIKQKAPNNILNIDDPLNFQKQVANGQLEKTNINSHTAFEIGDNNLKLEIIHLPNISS